MAPSDRSEIRKRPSQGYHAFETPRHLGWFLRLGALLDFPKQDADSGSTPGCGLWGLHEWKFCFILSSQPWNRKCFLNVSTEGNGFAPLQCMCIYVGCEASRGSVRMHDERCNSIWCKSFEMEPRGDLEMRVRKRWSNTNTNTNWGCKNDGCCCLFRYQLLWTYPSCRRSRHRKTLAPWLYASSG